MSDPYGRMPHACWNNGQVEHVEEVLEFPGGVSSASAGERYFADARDSVLDNWCISQNFVRDAVVLDVGCGAGRFALDLQREHPSMDVRGIELSPGASKIARHRGLRTTCGDFRRAVFQDEFDAIMFLGNNLGLLGRGTQITNALARLREWTHDGAVLVGTAGDPRLLPGTLRGQVDAASPGTFRARNVYSGDVGDWLEYTFMTFEYFESLLPHDIWKVLKLQVHEKRWAVELLAL